MVNFDITEIELFKKDWHLFADFFDFFCGANIGTGQTRAVYNFNLDNTKVVKIEKPSPEHGFMFDNLTEWEIWTNLSKNSNKIVREYAKFLAPCTRISGCGRILIQEKTTPVTKDELPKMVPYFIHDTHINNWGRLGKKVVCHDYANHNIYANMLKNKLVKPEWRV